MIRGYWHPKGSAARVRATFEVNDLQRYAVTLEDGTAYRGDSSTLNVSERLGNVERKIVLADGSIFTTLENDEVDRLFKGTQKVNSFVHYLESHYRAVIIAIFITIASGFSFFKWGIPWTSEKIAHALPYETNELIAAGSMKFLDKTMFDKSTLSEAQKDKIRSHFNEKTAKLSVVDENKIKYKIHFRSWTMRGVEIPNALALPSGDIVLTDKFVELTKNQDEIDAVVLHEMGHVVHRHGLEMMIEGTFVTVAVMMMTGDASGMGDFGVGLGTALVQSSYSRGHESEADLYAFEKMLQAGIDPKSFSNIMKRMTLYVEEENNQTKGSENEEFLDYFSSHPSTKKRVELANHYSECFNQGLTVCK